MYTVTSTYPFRKLGNIKDILKLIKEAGFDGYDLSIFTNRAELTDDMTLINYKDYISKAKELREYADSLGLKCLQVHAPFPVFFKNDKEKNDKGLIEAIKSIEVASILGAPIIVVHPDNHNNAEGNAKNYLTLLDTLKRCNIKVGVENMWNWDFEANKVIPAACSHPKDYKAHMELLPKEYFTACVDLGHCYIHKDTNGKEILEELGCYVGALHVHDNDKVGDSHALPFSMKMPFEEIMDTLVKINYQGNITLEVESLTHNMPKECLASCARLMCDTAKYIKNYIESHR